jgi:protein-tyrosine phosphatase
MERSTAPIGVLIPGQLALGPSPGAVSFEQLAAVGISAILCLQEVGECPAPSEPSQLGMRWARVPVADGHAGGAIGLDQLRRAVAQIRRWREEGRMVYVHCYAGIGRAPTVCAAYLAACEGSSLGEALARVKQARPLASPTAQQLLVLAEFVRRSRQETDSAC